LSQPKVVEPIFDLLPSGWLENAQVTKEQFDYCYLQSTGQKRKRRQYICGPEEGLDQNPIERIREYGAFLDQQNQEQFVREFNDHMQKGINEHFAAKGFPVVATGNQTGGGAEVASSPSAARSERKLPSESLYIHVNGAVKGPFNIEQLNALLAVEKITKDTACCHEGAEVWLTIKAYLA
jgi:hypothetical protein